MSSDAAIELKDVSKAYLVYKEPKDRLRQAVMPRLARAVRPLGRALGFDPGEPSYFRTYWALQSLSFAVAPGETVGVIGQNGSGKSTLLKLICGTLEPTTGEVVTRGRIGALLELGSGFNPEFTGRENVLLNASVLGLAREETLERLDDILAFADIGDFVDQPVKTYSSGMAMRLAFAVIAHVDADILVIDEALAVGDAYFVQKCMRWLRQFRERGTVLFCGHDTSAVMNLCRRAIWLDKGEARLVGEAKEVAEAYTAYMHVKAAGLPEDVVRFRRPSARRDGGPSAASAPEPPRPSRTLPPAAAPSRPVVFDWLGESTSFGSGDAEIVETRLGHADGEELVWIEGGEQVKVAVRALAKAAVEAPIVGFIVKDRLGQPITGTNTITTETPIRAMQPGEEVVVEFVFRLPLLASGRYSITAAMASGTLDAHVQLHWVHDAIVFDVHSPYNTGVLFAPALEATTARLVESRAARQPGSNVSNVR